MKVVRNIEISLEGDLVGAVIEVQPNRVKRTLWQVRVCWGFADATKLKEKE
jgi:hypothetical protein